MRRISDRGKLIKKLDSLFRQTLLEVRPRVCEWCNRPGDNLHVSHILPKGTYPKLRFCEGNVLLLCYRCHLHRWHKSPIEAHKFAQKLKGKNFEARLLLINSSMPKHNMFYLNNLFYSLNQQLERYDYEDNE